MVDTLLLVFGFDSEFGQDLHDGKEMLHSRRKFRRNGTTTLMSLTVKAFPDKAG